MVKDDDRRHASRVEGFALQDGPVSDPRPPGDDAQLDRRRFMSIAGCAALLVAAGEWMGARLDAGMHTVADVTVADATSLERGTARAVAAHDGRAALVVRLEDHDIVAFDRRCPHLGCPVLWSPQNNRFECPCHHAAFDARTGQVLFGPPRRGLTRANVGFA